MINFLDSGYTFGMGFGYMPYGGYSTYLGTPGFRGVADMSIAFNNFQRYMPLDYGIYGAANWGMEPYGGYWMSGAGYMGMFSWTMPAALALMGIYPQPYYPYQPAGPSAPLPPQPQPPPQYTPPARRPHDDDVEDRVEKKAEPKAEPKVDEKKPEEEKKADAKKPEEEKKPEDKKPGETQAPPVRRRRPVARPSRPTQNEVDRLNAIAAKAREAWTEADTSFVIRMQRKYPAAFRRAAPPPGAAPAGAAPVATPPVAPSATPWGRVWDAIRGK